MSKKEVEKYISVGDSITRERKLIEMGNCVNCKSIDNSACFCAHRNFKKLAKFPCDVYVGITVQEEVGDSWVQVSVQSKSQPDFGFGFRHYHCI